MQDGSNGIDRRRFMISGAAIGYSGLAYSGSGILTDDISPMNVASEGEIKMAQADKSVDGNLEAVNEKLVTDFCRDWSLKDADALEKYLAEDLYYQIAPGQPVIESYAQFKKQMGPFMTRMETIDWEILRSHVIGPVVMNERIDYFNAPDGSKSPSMRFHVVGHFLIEDGKIKVWKDWPMPGKEQFIG
jgi:limonene-1,2-epoxide hydrolase